VWRLRYTVIFFLICIVGVESKLCPLGMSATHWPIVPVPGDCEDGEFGGMNGRGNRITQRKPALTPLCPPQIPLDQTRDWTRAAAVGSQRLTASAMARPSVHSKFWLDRWKLFIFPIEWQCHQLELMSSFAEESTFRPEFSSAWSVGHQWSTE
jgi:hypothetical protein